MACPFIILPSLQNKPAAEIILKAMGRAINKTVTIAEIIKRRISGLHQITQIDSTDITDVWEPLEEGLDRLETTRHVSSIQITLSPNMLDMTHPGYQSPLPGDQLKQISTDVLEQPRRPRGGGRGGRGGFRGRGRGGTTFAGNQQESGAIDEHEGGGWGGFHGRARGRGRGRGGFRGRGGKPTNNNQDNLNQGPPVASESTQPEGSFRSRGGRPPRFRGRSNQGQAPVNT